MRSLCKVSILAKRQALFRTLEWQTDFMAPTDTSNVLCNLSTFLTPQLATHTSTGIHAPKSDLTRKIRPGDGQKYYSA